MPIKNNTDTRIRTNEVPVKVYVQGDCPCADSFLREGQLYASLYPQKDMPVFRGRGFLLFDFGKEMCGGIRIVYHCSPRPAKIRIRFGESVGECCAELGYKNAGNEHSLRDFEVTLPNFSDSVYGDTGFRFVRLDFTEDTEYKFYGVRAVSTHWNAVRQGSFESEDALLNKIFDTAAHTCGLCVQTQLWDGIKRDRLVWIGDLHPEAKALYCLYDDLSPIKEALDFAQELSEETGLRWVNGIPSYSFWWLINLCDYVKRTNDRQYLREKLSFVRAILDNLRDCVSADGTFDPGNEDMKYFLDWPTFHTEDACAGVHALAIWMLRQYLPLAEGELCKVCEELLAKMLKKQYGVQSKAAAALQVLSETASPQAYTILAEDGTGGMSCFMSYYILKAIAKVKGVDSALAVLRAYFGGMLEKGATTFWEDFDTDWMNGSGNLDDFPRSDRKDIHGDFGRFCYEGYRHSLCHGWSSGVVAFLFEEVAGIHYHGENVYEIVPRQSLAGKIKVALPTAEGVLRLTVSDTVDVEEKPRNVILMDN